MPASTTETVPTKHTVTVSVLLFSVLREQVGRSKLTVELDEPATGATLLDFLADEHASITRHRPVLRLAVNQTYCDETAELHDGDEVALITPVSGG